MTDSLKELLIKALEWIAELLVKVPELIQDYSNLDFDVTVIHAIQDSLIPIAVSLMTLFFVIEYASKAINPNWINLPNISLLMLKAIAFKAVITNCADMLDMLFQISASIFGKITSSALPDTDGINDVIEWIRDVDSGLGGIFLLIAYGIVVLLIFLVILGIVIGIYATLISRLVEIKIYQAIAPIALSTLVSDSLSSMGKRFLQSYLAVCLQNSIILLSIIVVTHLTESIINGDMFGNIKIVGVLVSYIILGLMTSKAGSISRSVVGL